MTSCVTPVTEARRHLSKHVLRDDYALAAGHSFEESREVGLGLVDVHVHRHRSTMVA